MVRKTLRNAEFRRDAVMAERPEGAGVVEARRENQSLLLRQPKKARLARAFYFPESCPTFPSKYRLVV